jgi:hypothetical protein
MNKKYKKGDHWGSRIPLCITPTCTDAACRVSSRAVMHLFNDPKTAHAGRPHRGAPTKSWDPNHEPCRGGPMWPPCHEVDCPDLKKCRSKDLPNRGNGKEKHYGHTLFSPVHGVRFILDLVRSKYGPNMEQSLWV